MFGVFATIGIKEGLILFYLRSKVVILARTRGHKLKIHTKVTKKLDTFEPKQECYAPRPPLCSAY